MQMSVSWGFSRSETFGLATLYKCVLKLNNNKIQQNCEWILPYFIVIILDENSFNVVKRQDMEKHIVL